MGLFGMLSGEQKLTWQVAKSPSIKVWQVEQKKTVAKPTKKRKALYYSIENFSLRTQFLVRSQSVGVSPTSFGHDFPEVAPKQQEKTKFKF